MRLSTPGIARAIRRAGDLAPHRSAEPTPGVLSGINLLAEQIRQEMRKEGIPESVIRAMDARIMDEQ